MSYLLWAKDKPAGVCTCLVLQESIFSDGLNSLKNVITLFSKPDIFVDSYNSRNLLPLTFVSIWSE